MTLDEIVAHHEIRELLYRYCRGVDRGDAEMIASVYHPDAEDDHGTFKGAGRDFANAIVARYDSIEGSGLHHVTNILVELDGDTAVGESYFISFNPDPAMVRSGSIRIVSGRYLDRFERRADSWRIARRQVIIDWAQAEEDGSAWERLSHFSRGGRREADPTAGAFCGAAAIRSR